jgi:hypothetical protein
MDCFYFHILVNHVVLVRYCEYAIRIGLLNIMELIEILFIKTQCYVFTW